MMTQVFGPMPPQKGDKNGIPGFSPDQSWTWGGGLAFRKEASRWEIFLPIALSFKQMKTNEHLKTKKGPIPISMYKCKLNRGLSQPTGPKLG